MELVKVFPEGRCFLLEEGVERRRFAYPGPTESVRHYAVSPRTDRPKAAKLVKSGPYLMCLIGRGYRDLPLSFEKVRGFWGLVCRGPCPSFDYLSL